MLFKFVKNFISITACSNDNEPRSLSAKKFSRGGSVPLFLVLLAYHDRLLNRPSPPLPFILTVAHPLVRTMISLSPAFRC